MSARKTAATERSLIGRGVLAVIAAYSTILLARYSLTSRFDWSLLYPLAGFVGLALLLRAVLHAVRFRGDQVLLAAAIFLAGLGMALQVRLGTLDFNLMGRWSNYALPAGVILMVLLAVFLRGGRIRVLAGTYVPAALVALAVLGGVLLAGRRFRGGVYLAGNMNPTELVKVLLTIYLAGLFTVYRKSFEKPVVPGLPAWNPGMLLSLAVCWLAPMGLLVVLRDLGLMVLLNMVLLIMAVLASGCWSYLLTGLLLAGGAGVALIAVMPHGGVRVDVWLNPFSDPTGRGWQILQGLSAMYTGGLWGAGLGAGHPAAIPIAASDFIYAALSEEIGYAGCGLVLGVYLLFFYRGFRLADSLRDPFSQSLATGLTAALAMQTLINLGGVTKAIPLTGITLPFLSHGGSSLITSFVMLGLLLALSDPGKK